MANVKITTGQYVNLEQRMASVSDRVFAQLLDVIFMWVYVSIISVIFSIVFLSVISNQSYRYENTMLIIYFLLLLPFIFYHPIFEYFFKTFFFFLYLQNFQYRIYFPNKVILLRSNHRLKKKYFYFLLMLFHQFSMPPDFVDVFMKQCV